ncbi:hypothetical protein KSP40_PGU011788 [Platanthera guangdongensis]|uniref:Thylakoid lumenal 17.9 kDa protein, chloroplastic n=1 Tax=Platanthera guangdongensis TaxID=2320717 RepID=A0ABR2N1F5_9ASPA
MVIVGFQIYLPPFSPMLSPELLQDCCSSVPKPWTTCPWGIEVRNLFHSDIVWPAVVSGRRVILVSPKTPYTQVHKQSNVRQRIRIRPCPSTNPGCVSTNPKSSSFSFPLVIPEDSLENAVQKLGDAIVRTQRNVRFEVDEDTPSGRFLLVEVDGGFGRDVIEFLVTGDIVAYRSMATMVTYIYPFTTTLGDSKGQEERINKIKAELGWSSPSFVLDLRTPFSTPKPGSKMRRSSSSIAASRACIDSVGAGCVVFCVVLLSLFGFWLEPWSRSGICRFGALPYTEQTSDLVIVDSSPDLVVVDSSPDLVVVDSSPDIIVVDSSPNLVVG